MTYEDVTPCPPISSSTEPDCNLFYIVEINHDKIFFQDQSPVGALIVKPYFLKSSLILSGYSKDG